VKVPNFFYRSRTSTVANLHPDVLEILAMVRELASFEESSSAVLATEELLLQTLSFAPSPATLTGRPPSNSPGYAKTLLLSTPENSVAAMALYFTNYSTWRAKPGIYLEDLFVRPQYRRRGYATMLLRRLAQEALRLEPVGGGRLEWSCLRWNENALKFYRGLGAKEMGEWVGLRVDGESLAALAERDIEVKEQEKVRD
jgi:GNAT superfamily N-acetyltransferase